MGGGEGESWRRGCDGVIEREKTLCCTRDGAERGRGPGGCSRETVVEKEEEDGVEESRRRRGGRATFQKAAAAVVLVGNQREREEKDLVSRRGCGP